MRVFGIQKSAFDFGFGGPSVWSRRTRVTLFGKSIFFLMDDEGSKMQMVDIGFAPLIRLGVGVRPAQPDSPLLSLREGHDFLSFHLLNLGISFSPQGKSKLRFWWGDRRLFYKGSRLATILTMVAALLVAGPAMAQSWDSGRADSVVRAMVSSDNFEESFMVTCDISERFPEPYFTLKVGGDGGGIGPVGEFLPADFLIDHRPVRSFVQVEEENGIIVYTLRANSSASTDHFEAIAARLRAGRSLTVSIPAIGIRESFPLDGANAAISTVLEDCG